MARDNKKSKQEKEKTQPKNPIQQVEREVVAQTRTMAGFSPKLVGAIADEVARTLVQRLPELIRHPRRAKTPPSKHLKQSGPFIFLDTSAIIDGRIFDVINSGLVSDTVVILESVLSELKHIADSKEPLKKDRGRNGLEFLEKLKKGKKVKVMVLSNKDEKKYSDPTIREVDDKLIAIAKENKGKVVTCDYNLEKKSTIQGVITINMNALAQGLKVRAIPGQVVSLQLQHAGKNETQGVGYMDDGTMIVVENAVTDVGKTLDVTVTRVIQTAAGRILFARKI